MRGRGGRQTPKKEIKVASSCPTFGYNGGAPRAPKIRSKPPSLEPPPFELPPSPPVNLSMIEDDEPVARSLSSSFNHRGFVSFSMPAPRHPQQFDLSRSPDDPQLDPWQMPDTGCIAHSPTVLSVLAHKKRHIPPRYPTENKVKRDDDIDLEASPPSSPELEDPDGLQFAISLEDDKGSSMLNDLDLDSLSLY